MNAKLARTLILNAGAKVEAARIKLDKAKQELTMADNLLSEALRHLEKMITLIREELDESQIP